LCLNNIDYLFHVTTPVSPFAELPALNQVAVPDLWQQQAVTALREGKDVVVHAPTGAGKTLIFELWSNQGKNRGQAIYTVPTRALANDKLAEWRARGWDVGIATGDLADNLNAPMLVATLETQKNRLIQGDGPALLVVDEYQMIRDPDRGLNYELAIALAPAQTQLLLLSGSVANPQDVVKWLTRLGRNAVLVRNDHRPVPLEEVHANNLSFHLPSEIRGYWPRLIAKSLADDLGPVLVFAPRRQAAESMAAELSRTLPTPNPLQLTTEQKQIVGEHLGRLLKARVAYHHSGLSYAVRAGVIEPLAKAGQLRVVVATMGLAAGINFSLRSVALAGESYRRDAVEESLKHPVVPCNLHTDAERARHVRKLVREMLNSRGEWETVPAPTEKTLREIFIANRPHSGPLPQERENGVDAGENSAPKVANAAIGKTEINVLPASCRQEDASTENCRQDAGSTLRSILTEPIALEKVGHGALVVLKEENGLKTYGRAVSVAERLNDDRVLIAKWIRRMTNWNGRQAPFAVWQEKIAPLVEQNFAKQKTPVIRFEVQPHKIVAHVSLSDLTMRVPVDKYGVALWRPLEREVLPYDCAQCALVPVCKQLSTATGTALLWRRLNLVDAAGVPTRRGRLVSFFSQGDGLAIAAALEDERYPLEEFIYDLANLDAGFRFCGDENRYAGRLAMVCHEKFGLQSIPGYLENGLPPKYGAGAEQIVASVHKNPLAKQGWLTDLVGVGDIDRVIIEWRSLLRQISHAPDLDWPRWRALQAMAKTILNETESPTLTDLPPLAYNQTRRVDHRLILRRH
jgi:hypothetical protein